MSDLPICSFVCIFFFSANAIVFNGKDHTSFEPEKVQFFLQDLKITKNAIDYIFYSQESDSQLQSDRIMVTQHSKKHANGGISIKF